MPENNAVDLSALEGLVDGLKNIVTIVIGISVTVMGFFIGSRILKRFVN